MPNEKDKFRFSMGQGELKMLPSSEGNSLRSFSGVAYTGKPITGHWYWGTVVFDLSSTSASLPIPVLIDHDPMHRAGYATEMRIDTAEGILIEGNLLTNDDGVAVSRDSDEGFPWQMSVNIEPGSIEEIQPGNSVMVNGFTLAGPATIFRNSSILETSFCALGYDSNTSAAAMSKSGSTTTNEGNDMDLNQALARIAELEAEKVAIDTAASTLRDQLTAATAQIEKFSRETRVAEIKTLYSEIGREFIEDAPEVKVFSAASKEVWDAAAATLRDLTKGRDNGTLFSHEATSGTSERSGEPTSKANSLVEEAKRRATDFSRSRQAA